ncbi:MAG: hypothetical protein HYU87_07630 [Chloroflexi bacterium]|nr:hypothetical protein [Chloroflexota bacterium]
MPQGTSLAAHACHSVRVNEGIPPEGPRARTPHGDLSLEEIAESLPGTADLMALIGTAWWKCAHAARGGNWELAGYFARRVRATGRRLAVVRPKYGADIARFEEERIAPVLAATQEQDADAFETAFAAATDEANAFHAKWGKSYIRWTLPSEPPRDLDLGPR